MLSLSTKSCLKSSKLRPILNGQFCHEISKSIGLNVLGCKQPRKILFFCDSQTLISPFWAKYAPSSSYRRIICSCSNYPEHIGAFANGGWFVPVVDKGGFFDAPRSNYRSILSSCRYCMEDFDHRNILVDSGSIVHWSDLKCHMSNFQIPNLTPFSLRKTPKTLVAVFNLFEIFIIDFSIAALCLKTIMTNFALSLSGNKDLYNK